MASLTSERFTATAMCPACNAVDCHRIRPPHPAPTASEIAEWERIVEVTEVRRFGGEVVNRIEHPPRPVDESRYEVIRTCQCGHEWGQGCSD